MPAVRRLGLLLPSSGTVREADFYRRVSESVTGQSGRMRRLEATEADEIGMLEEHTLPAARDLATIRPDVVVFSCTRRAPSAATSTRRLAAPTSPR